MADGMPMDEVPVTNDVDDPYFLHQLSSFRLYGIFYQRKRPGLRKFFECWVCTSKQQAESIAAILIK